MALTKIPRGLLDTGIADSSDATAITIDSSENVTFAGNIKTTGTKKIEFGDSGTYIHQSADGVLDLVSDTEIEINATTIDVNGNVGVGVTPTAPLHVDGAQAYASSATNLSTTVSKAAFRMQGSSDSSTSLFMGALTNDAQMYIQSSNGAGSAADDIVLNPFGGSVGIGVGNASPARIFHVKGPDSVGTTAKFENVGTSTYIQLTADSQADNASAYIGYDDSKDLSFWTDDTRQVNIDSSGRLLVGSNAALSVTGGARQFQIEGTTGVTAAMSIIRHSNSAGGATISLSKSRATADGGVTVVADNDVLGELRFTGADGSDHDAVAAAIKGEVDGTPGSNDMPARLTFWTTSDGSASETERFRIDPNGAVRNMGATMAPTSHTTERTFAVSFPNGVANQKFKLILSNTWWGTFDVALTGTYSNQNMAGILEKRFGSGLNANNVYTNKSRILESLGPISDNFHIGDIEWDSSLSKWVIVITHRVSTGNVLRLRVRTFAEPAGGGGQTSALSFTVGSVYTTDSTTYGQQKRIPCFHANLSSSVAVGANAIVFNAETFDSGGNYNTSNGRFTAPEDGVYSFSMNLLIYPHTGGVLNPKFLLNGSQYGYMVQQGHANNSHTAVSRTSLISMSRGQYVQVLCGEGTSVNSGCNIHGGQSYFTGHLVAEGNP